MHEGVEEPPLDDPDRQHGRCLARTHHSRTLSTRQPPPAARHTGPGEDYRASAALRRLAEEQFEDDRVRQWEEAAVGQRPVPPRPHPRRFAQPIEHGDITCPELISLRTQNTRFRRELVALNQHFDNRLHDWQTERDRLRDNITELRHVVEARTHSLREVDRLLATSTNQLVTERTHLRAIAQHIRHIEVDEIDSDDSGNLDNILRDDFLLDNEPLPQRRRFQ